MGAIKFAGQRVVPRQLQQLLVAGATFIVDPDDAMGARILHLLADPRLGWRDLCEKPVRNIRVDGSHATLLHAPHAAHIAADLGTLLKEANRRSVVK